MKEADFVDWMQNEHGPRTSVASCRSGPFAVSSGRPYNYNLVSGFQRMIGRLDGHREFLDLYGAALIFGSVSIGFGRESIHPGPLEAIIGALIGAIGLIIHRKRVLVNILAGVVGGSAIGGAVLWWIGHVAFASPEGSLLGSLAFVVSFIAFVGSPIAPLSLGLACRDAFETQAGREVLTIGAYVLMAIGAVGLGVSSMIFLNGAGFETAQEAMALLNAVFGATMGGILGGKAGRRLGSS